MKARICAILALALALSFTFGCTQQSSSNQPPTSPATDANQTTSSTPAASPAKESAAEEKREAKAAAPKMPAKTNPAPATPAAPAPAPLVVASGTGITIRLGSAVGSKISNAGDPFNGTTTQDISASDGRVAIPAGSAVSGAVSDAKPLGRFAGGASISLTLHSVTVGGRTYNISTSTFADTEKGKGKRTAVLGVGGAAVGALIGGLAGGGKGAGIGALAGGGAGTAGAALTGNKDIILPAEKALTFKLASDLTIK